MTNIHLARQRGLETRCELPVLASIESPDTAKANHQRVLLVDDESCVRRMLARGLERYGHDCMESEMGQDAIRQVMDGGIDVVLADLDMPGMGGIDLLRRLKALDADLPVIIISGTQQITEAVHAMRLGADDYLAKPFLIESVQVSIEKALNNRALKLQVRAYQKRLETMVEERTSQIQRLFMNVIQSLIHTLEAKDPYTNGHSKRVAWLAHQLGLAAELSGDELDVLQLAAMLHDLGKIGIRESVLQKKGILTTEEYEHIKEHVTHGVRILGPLEELKPIIPLIRHHHERYDGGGYPCGLEAGMIPYGARIITIADAFDAMMSARPYRAAISAEDTINRLRFGSGTQFDPELVEKFLPLTREEAIQDVLASPHWASCQPTHLDLPAADYASIFLPEQAV